MISAVVVNSLGLPAVFLEGLPAVFVAGWRNGGLVSQ